MDIIQGDSGTSIEYEVLRKIDGVYKKVDLTDCTIVFKINDGKMTHDIPGYVVDALNGIAGTELNATHTVESGEYQIQVKVTFPNTKTFSTVLQKFNVKRGL